MTPLLAAPLLWVLPAFAALGTVAPGSVRRLLGPVAAALAAAALLRGGLFLEAAELGLLRRPGFAAVGVWIVVALLVLARRLDLAGLTGFVLRAIVAFALVEQAALATWAVAGHDPFAVEPTPLAPVHAAYGLALLGAALAAGAASLAALGAGRGVLDLAAAFAAAASLAGPLYPGLGALPPTLWGDLSLALVATAATAAFLAALEKDGPLGAVLTPLALVLAVAAPGLLAIALQEIPA